VTGPVTGRGKADNGAKEGGASTEQRGQHKSLGNGVGGQHEEISTGRKVNYI
jgi:hypothetical protein